MNTQKGTGVFAANKRILHEFVLQEEFEAGVELQGWEVKAIRARVFAFGDSYCRFYGSDLRLVQMSIGPYKFANVSDKDVKRSRRLLLHRRELNRIAAFISQQGLTVVPAALIISDRGLVKVTLAIGRFRSTKGSRDSFERKRVQVEIRRYVR
ncbi:MAG: SsrA-binding protein [Caldisericota bacterium]|nr:SsrA-binding protein [Caldisericota bacterium]